MVQKEDSEEDTNAKADLVAPVDETKAEKAPKKVYKPTGKPRGRPKKVENRGRKKKAAE